MIETIFRPLRRYAEFHGRSGRPEFWGFSFASLIVIVGLSTLLGMLGESVSGDANGTGFVGQVLQFFVLIGCLILFLPQLAVTVRRLHDQERSGWFILLSLVPVVGSLLLLILLALPGDSAGNNYGPPDPIAN